MRNYDNYTVIDAVQASGADVDMDRGYMTVTGLGDAIPVNRILGVTLDSYTAGTASVKTYNLAGLTYNAGDVYFVELRQPNTDFVKRYHYFPEATPSGALFVDSLVAQMNLDTTCPVTAVDATASIQLTLDDATKGDFTVDVYRNGVDQAIAPTVGTPFVQPVGTPALMRIEVGDDSVGDNASTYDRYVISYSDPFYHSSNNSVDGALKVVAIYLNAADGDAGSFDLADYIDGSKTGKTYNGAKNYVLDGVAQ